MKLLSLKKKYRLYFFQLTIRYNYNVSSYIRAKLNQCYILSLRLSLVQKWISREILHTSDFTYDLLSGVYNEIFKA